MSFRTIVTAALLAATTIPGAFAATAVTWVGGEAGFREYQVPSQLTRQQVQEELRVFEAHPVDALGGRHVGGEVGYVQHQHTYVLREGVKVHTDGFTATMGMGAAAPYGPATPRPGSEYWEVTPF